MHVHDSRVYNTTSVQWRSHRGKALITYGRDELRSEKQKAKSPNS